MTERQSKRVSTASKFGYGFALVAATLSLALRAVAAHADGFSWAEVITMLLLILGGILILVFVLFEIFAWLDRVRTRQLADAYPNAFIGTVATDPSLVSEADAFARQSTGKRTKLVASVYMSLVADRDQVRFFRGWRKPRVVASFPSSVVERVEVGATEAGARMVPCLDLVCLDGGAEGRISIHLIRFGRMVPRFVRGDALVDVVQRFRMAAGVRDTAG